MSTYGSTIKKIRHNKGYTQKDVVGSLFSQSTYSNFEAEKSDIHMTSFIYLLSQFQLSTEELQYIHNGYEYDAITNIIRSFFRLPYNDTKAIIGVIKSIDNYHRGGNKNLFLEELKSICEALIILETSGDFDKARDKVSAVWERISRFDQWYLMDIKIMNVILYFFEYEVAINITDKLLLRLKIYNNFEDVVKLTFTLTLNLSLILIKNGLYKEASARLDELLKDFLTEMPYKVLAICYNRKAICYSFTSKEKEMLYLNKKNILLEIYEDDIFKQLAQHEFNTYHKNFFHITLLFNFSHFLYISLIPHTYTTK